MFTGFAQNITFNIKTKNDSHIYDSRFATGDRNLERSGLTQPASPLLWVSISPHIGYPPLRYGTGPGRGALADRYRNTRRTQGSGPS